MAIDAPDRTAMALRRVATVVALVGVVATALLVASNEPPKLTAKTLVASVEDETGSAAVMHGTCRRLAAKSWSCSVEDRSGSGGDTYAVEVTSEHCWRARKTDDYGEPGMPETAHGCLH